MINAHFPGITTSNRIGSSVHRVSPRGFWMLFAFEAMFVATMLIVALHFLLPVRAPLAQGNDYVAVREAVWSRLNGATPDPLIEIAPSVTVHSSAVRGFTLNNQVYYYYLEGQRGFDPLSRGAVDKRSIDVVLRDDGGPKTLVIYRLTNQ